jgi:hypothetical protein
MAGLSWDAPELLLLIIYEQRGLRYIYIYEKLLKMGACRTLEGVRSKLCELRKVAYVFDCI